MPNLISTGSWSHEEAWCANMVLRLEEGRMGQDGSGG